MVKIVAIMGQPLTIWNPMLWLGIVGLLANLYLLKLLV